MNAEQVVEKILSEARAEAEQIKAAAAEKCAAAEVELNSELADYEKQSQAGQISGNLFQSGDEIYFTLSH